MKNRKKAVIISIIVLCILIFGIIKIVSDMIPEFIATNNPLIVDSSYNSPANNWQYETDIWMGVYNHQLYFLPSKPEISSSKYYNCLCTIENGKIVRLVSIKKIKPSIIGFVNETLYIQSEPHQEQNHSQDDYALYDVRLSDMELKKIFSFSQLSDRNNRYARFLKNTFYQDNGEVYIPILPEHGEDPSFLQVLDDTVLAITKIQTEYTVGEYRYSLEYEYGDDCEHVVQTNQDGKRERLDFGRATLRTVIPTKNGLLVHNVRPLLSEEILYYIDETGTVTTLFSTPQLRSYSSVTVYENDVYLSVKRYEDWGEIGMKGYEADTIEGTYHISLADYSVNKINDRVFSGLYIFDHSGIYACSDNCSIYKMDFDGSIIEEILVLK